MKPRVPTRIQHGERLPFNLKFKKHENEKRVAHKMRLAPGRPSRTRNEPYGDRQTRLFTPQETITDTKKTSIFPPYAPTLREQKIEKKTKQNKKSKPVKKERLLGRPRAC